MTLFEVMDNDLLMYGGHLCRFVIRSSDAVVQRVHDFSEFPPCVLSVSDPIPLTEEILKKNGFHTEEFEYGEVGWFPKEGCTYITQYPHQNPIFALECTDIELEYVHELQHALRLCRLTELADNFKV